MGITEKVWSMITPGNTLFYPGCMVKYVLEEIFNNYRTILKKMNIDFIELGQGELCCGSPAVSGGYEKDFKKIVEKNSALFNEHDVKTIITPCPGCYKTFVKYYPKFKVIHISQLILQKAKLSKISDEKVTYHDPCHLGRHIKSMKKAPIYDQPREILKRMGFKIIEMKKSRDNSMCCGGGGGVRGNFPDTANAIAKRRLMQAKELGVKKLITPCPMCYAHLKENSKGTGVEVLELSQLVVGAMK